MSANESLRHEVDAALHGFAAPSLRNAATSLFATLGYASERRLDVGTVADFLAAYNTAGRLDPTRARSDSWLAVEMLFQLTDAELSAQGNMFAAGGFQPQTYEAFLFFAIELPAGTYSRSELATITREVNKLFTMPVSVLFRYGPLLTLAIVTHRPNLQDNSRDVLEKVTLVKDIAYAAPHRAHIAILGDLALPVLHEQYPFSSFDGLQHAWRQALDVSELNRRFFRELANWYFWAVQETEFPAGAEPDRGVRNATSVIRLITRLIFVWFLKEKGLVPEQLFRQAEVQALLHDTSEASSSYYQAVVQNLFFATLNTEMDSTSAPRKFRSRSASGGRDGNFMAHTLYRYEAQFRDAEAALALFRQVPFLNGGLFECLDRESATGTAVRVDGFSDRPDNPLRVPNRLFWGGEREVDLNATYGTKGKRYKARGLLHILHSYKFTVAENTPIEEEVALDPELLGQVFENLLANYNPETATTARKQTGSFYTPRQIVTYMVDESLVAAFAQSLREGAALLAGVDTSPALEERLRRLLAYTAEPHDFSPPEVALLIGAIDTLKILDPACGSGAFPMGILQQLVHVLSKIDPRNARWKERQIERVERTRREAEQIDDADARERTLRDLDTRVAEIEEAFERNELDYGRKLFLIENCIYGVDIQPIAVQIAKLRCFIALIVDQRVDSGHPNRGVRPLPNLETKFVAANTLLGLPQQGGLRSQEVIALEGQLANVRRRHFSARTPATKRKYREQDQALRTRLGVLLHQEGASPETARALAAWDPYDQNAKADFFDPEWMFGVDDGFDIAIANPPYVRQEGLGTLKPLLQQQYRCYTGVADLYVYFYERGLQLLRDGGVLTYISSNKYFRAGYGAKLRGYMASTTTIAQLIDFGDAPVFTAIAYPSIIVARKEPPPEATPHTVRAFNWPEGPPVSAFAEAFRGGSFLLLQKELTSDGWRLESPTTLRLLEKLRRAGTPLGEYVGGRFYYGIKTGLNEAFVVDRATRDALIAAHPSSADLLKPFLRGRDVKRWRVSFADQYLIKIESSENKQHPWSRKPDREAERVFAATYPAIHNRLDAMREKLINRDDQGKYFWELRSCAYWHEFEQQKIIYPDISKYCEVALDASESILDCTLFMLPKMPNCIAGLLNSKAVQFFINQVTPSVRGDYRRFKTIYVSQVPAPNKIVELETPIKGILAAKRANPGADVAALEAEIDALVYRLYGLDAGEIALVEESVRR